MNVEANDTFDCAHCHQTFDIKLANMLENDDLVCDICYAKVVPDSVVNAMLEETESGMTDN